MSRTLPHYLRYNEWINQQLRQIERVSARWREIN